MFKAKGASQGANIFGDAARLKSLVELFGWTLPGVYTPGSGRFGPFVSCLFSSPL